MRKTVKMLRDSELVRNKEAVIRERGLQLNETVDVRSEQGQNIIKPLHEADLPELIAGITPDNIHAEVDFGAPCGDEAF